MNEYINEQKTHFSSIARVPNIRVEWITDLTSRRCANWENKSQGDLDFGWERDKTHSKSYDTSITYRSSRRAGHRGVSSAPLSILDSEFTHYPCSPFSSQVPSSSLYVYPCSLCIDLACQWTKARMETGTTTQIREVRDSNLEWALEIFRDEIDDEKQIISRSQSSELRHSRSFETWKSGVTRDYAWLRPRNSNCSSFSYFHANMVASSTKRAMLDGECSQVR